MQNIRNVAFTTVSREMPVKSIHMKLALNTLVYEVGNKGPEESLRAAVKYGFKYIEYAGIRMCISSVIIPTNLLRQSKT